MKKTAFTLVEVTIVLVLIGVLATILLPVAFNSTPDKNLVKFKRAYDTYITALQELINSDKYYLNGDMRVKSNGELIDYTHEIDSAYFCESFSNFIHLKEKSCKKNGSALVSALPTFEGQRVDCPGGSVTWNPGETHHAEAFCNPPNKSNISYVKDINNVLYYYAPQNFNSETHGVPFSEYCVDEFGNSLQYEFHCIDIDGFDYGEDPFWIALRYDGRIVNSPRVQEWLGKFSTKAN
ncbi:MAG: type II secretion system protein [Candidatus Gastranaerophilales bacterium]|nr:type II secretion system protein [Candidatus Gastranaerophilales bacterium]